MKWSKLKQRVESNFAASVRGRVQVWNTRYRGSHDAEGEAWITVDGERVWSMASLSYMIAHSDEEARIRAERGCSDGPSREKSVACESAWEEAQANVHDEGVFAMWDLNGALFALLNMSIDHAIQSDNPIVRAFAILDGRFGKRRLRRFDDSREHPLVKAMFRFRCDAEGIRMEPDGTPDR